MSKPQKVYTTLNYLKQDLDLWNHQLRAFLNDPKNLRDADEKGKEIVIEMVEKFYSRKLLTKQDIHDTFEEEEEVERQKSGTSATSAKRKKKARQFRSKDGRLNILVNYIDKWHHQVCAMLDGKAPPSMKELRTFALEKLTILHSKKFIMKEDINSLNLRDPELTPKRSCSASPNRAPLLDRCRLAKFSNENENSPTELVQRQRRSKSASDKIQSPENDDIRIQINFQDENAKYNRDCNKCKEKVEQQSRQISILDLQLKSLQGYNGRLQYELNVLKKEKDNSKITSLCRECAANRNETERYKAAMYNAKYERDKAIQINEKCIGEISRLEQQNERLVIALDEAKREKDLECEIDRFLPKIDLLKDNEDMRKRLSETDRSLAYYEKENTALKNTIDNQKLMILEIENRKELLKQTEAKLKTTEELLKDIQIAMSINEDTYKKEKGRASKQIRFLENKINRLQTQCTEAEERCKKLTQANIEVACLENQKKEILKLLQKHKSESSVSIENIKQELKEEKTKSRQLQTKVEMLEQSNETRKQREIEDLKRIDRKHQDLQDKNEFLQKHIEELEIMLAKEKQKQIDIERKYQQKFREERNPDPTMIKELKREVTSAKAKLNEQQALSRIEKDNLEKNIRDLKNKLSKADEIKWDFISTESCKYHQEQLDQKNEELSSLTRQLFSLKNEYSSYSSTRLSDIEKENASLNQKLSEESKSLSDVREICRQLKEKTEIEKQHYENASKTHHKEKEFLTADNGRLKEHIKQLNEELNRIRSKDNLQKKSSNEETNRLCEMIQEVEQEKQNIQAKVSELSDANLAFELRIKSMTSDLLELEVLKSKNKDLTSSLAILQAEFKELECRYKSEAAVRQHANQDSIHIKEENERLRRERDSTKKEVVKLQREKKDLSEQLQTEIVSSKSELQKLTREKTELTELFREESNRANAKIEKLEIEKEDLQIRYKSDVALRKRTDEDYDHMKDENERLRRERSVARNEVHKLSRENKELSEQLQTEVTKFKKDKSELTELFKGESNRVKEKIEKLESEKSDLQKRIPSAEKSNQQIAYELMQLKNDLGVVKNKKALLEDELSDLKQDYSELERELRKQQQNTDEFTELKNDLESCQIQKRSAEKKILELQKENSHLNNQIASKENTMSGEREKITALETKINQLQSDNEDLNNSCRQKDGKLRKMDDEMEKLRKEIRDLQTKVIGQKSEKETLNTRYEALFREKQEAEGKNRECGNCKMLQRQVNALKDDNKAVRKELDQKELLLEKASKDMAQIKAEKSRLGAALIVEKQEKETLSTKLEDLRTEKLDLENRLKHKPQVATEQKSCPNCWKYKNDISDLKREVNDLRDRLSEAAGNKLRENNPNIADLSDMNRPTSLAEKFSSLYTDEYTDAMEVIEDNLDESGCVRVMLKWLKNCSDLCENIANEQRNELRNNSIGFMRTYSQQADVVLSDRCLIYVKEFQKKIAVESLAAVGKICHMKSVTDENLTNNNFIIKYIKKCTELCWMMQISDPPLYLNFDVKKGENLDKNVYNVFTHSGSKIDYLVWPALYLHTTGPMLAKGVAQGM